MPRLVIHVDDVGMCHGANQAFVELARRGTISAGSVMVPCPWFPEIASIAAADPSLDVGVHLTLNAEQSGYRWAPLTRPSAAAGLTDDDGSCWATVDAVRRHAHPDAVEAEWRAQIDRALAADIDVTHLDAHMGSALAPEWSDRYVALGVEYGVPVLTTATLDAYGPHGHLADVAEHDHAPMAERARASGMPVFDEVLETDFSRARGVRPDYESMLTGAVGDLVYGAFHPCVAGPGEIERIEPDAHHVRVDEYDLFRTEAWAEWLAEQPFEVVGMRPLREEMRAATTAP